MGCPELIGLFALNTGSDLDHTRANTVASQISNVLKMCPSRFDRFSQVYVNMEANTICPPHFGSFKSSWKRRNDQNETGRFRICATFARLVLVAFRHFSQHTSAKAAKTRRAESRASQTICPISNVFKIYPSRFGRFSLL